MAIHGHADFPRTSQDGRWRISPYPDRHRFAFTIVHDADSAYSKRLAPLFEEFDRLGLRLTVTVFPLWAQWGRNGQVWEKWTGGTEAEQFFGPVAIPLEDEPERAFYLELARRGHEIGMHTPSETSSTREDVIRAYEYFKDLFGEYPKVYVEHSAGNNMDAQVNHGSDPSSEYYNTDLLNQYGSWIWLCRSNPRARAQDEHVFDLLALQGTPFDRAALERFGIAKGFHRTGHRLAREGGNTVGDTFLRAYSRENVDRLVARGGLALVYNHLAFGWLDQETRRMREPIVECLEYIASQDGWFVPASTILDRFEAMSGVHVSASERWVKVVNAGDRAVPGVTLVSEDGVALGAGPQALVPDDHGSILIGTIGPAQTLSFEVLRRQEARPDATMPGSDPGPARKGAASR